VILRKFWSRYDLHNFRRRFFWGDDQGELSNGTTRKIRPHPLYMSARKMWQMSDRHRRHQTWMSGCGLSCLGLCVLVTSGGASDPPVFPRFRGSRKRRSRSAAQPLGMGLCGRATRRRSWRRWRNMLEHNPLKMGHDPE
jgi:hypothetical protein